MSPDPPRPREESTDDENQIGRLSGEVIEGLVDDHEFFIVPDAPYELDMEVESDDTDTDDEGAGVLGAGALHSMPLGAGPSATTDLSSGQEFVFEGQARGRYRLLIPFPAPISSTSSGSEETSNSNTEETGDKNQSEYVPEVSNDSTVTNVSQNVSEAGYSGTQCQDQDQDETQSMTEKSKEDKREIDLSDEKVEAIKQAMKNITLPPAAIPKWASGIDDDVWRKKINDTLVIKTSRGSSKDKDSAINDRGVK